MIRLIAVVEGRTEEEFVRRVLRPHLRSHGVSASATIVGKVRREQRPKAERGGGRFQDWRKDLRRILGARDPSLRVTTLFDLYGLPEDFPGFSQHGDAPDTARRCEALERSLAEEIRDRRFLPYIQRHEFETLVLAALPSLEKILDARDDREGLTRLREELAGRRPEDVNDGPRSAPSKRLQHWIPGYRKTLHGPYAVGDTGLVSVRERCSRFGEWLKSLESLGQGLP